VRTAFASLARSSPPSPNPRPRFGGMDLHHTLVEKAAALGLSLIQSHPFVDRNKRVGHAAMETFLLLNGTEIVAPMDAQERLVLDLAAGRIGRGELTDWLRQHLKPLT
jgi:death on curing protein